MISAQQSYVQYIADGTTGTFTFPYRFLDASDLRVWLSTASLTTEITAFTVTGDGTSGGLISLTTWPSAGDVVTIKRIMSPTQLMNYIANDNFPAESHEAALDKLTMLIQQIIDGSSHRVIRFPTTDPLTVNEVLPIFTERANTVLIFDEDGQMGVMPLATLIAQLPIVAGSANLTCSAPAGTTFIKTITISTGITGQYQRVRAWLIDGTTPTTVPTAKAPLNSRAAEWDVITDTNGEVTVTVDHTGGALQTWRLCVEYLGQVAISQAITLGT